MKKHWRVYHFTEGKYEVSFIDLRKMYRLMKIKYNPTYRYEALVSDGETCCIYRSNEVIQPEDLIERFKNDSS